MSLQPNVPNVPNDQPPAYPLSPDQRASMEEEGRPLPDGWIRDFDRKCVICVSLHLPTANIVPSARIIISMSTLGLSPRVPPGSTHGKTLNGKEKTRKSMSGAIFTGSKLQVVLLLVPLLVPEVELWVLRVQQVKEVGNLIRRMSLKKCLERKRRELKLNA